MTDRRTAYETALQNLKNARAARQAADDAASAYADDPELGPRLAQAAQEAHQRHALALTAYCDARDARRALGSVPPRTALPHPS